MNKKESTQHSTSAKRKLSAGFTPTPMHIGVSPAKAGRGFTLIELLVTISIISVMSSVVVSALTEVRTKAKDTNRLQVVEQIATAIDLYHNEYGVYPNTGDTLAHCVGNYPDNDCGINGQGNVDAALNNALLEFIPELTVLSEVYFELEVVGDLLIEGLTYRCFDAVCSGVRLEWGMEQTLTSCGRGRIVSPEDTVVGTLCILYLQEL